MYPFIDTPEKRKLSTQRQYEEERRKFKEGAVSLPTLNEFKDEKTKIARDLASNNHLPQMISFAEIKQLILDPTKGIKQGGILLRSEGGNESGIRALKKIIDLQAHDTIFKGIILFSILKPDPIKGIDKFEAMYALYDSKTQEQMITVSFKEENAKSSTTTNTSMNEDKARRILKLSLGSALARAEVTKAFKEESLRRSKLTGDAAKLDEVTEAKNFLLRKYSN